MTRSSIVIQKQLKNTRKSQTVALGDIVLDYFEHTLYLDLIPHTQSCCWEFSLQHQMRINPPLEIIPNNRLFAPFWAFDFLDQVKL